MKLGILPALLPWLLLGEPLLTAGLQKAAPEPQQRPASTPLQSLAPELTREQAARFADLALACVSREYPNKLDHVMNDRREVQSPRELHPAFYGCFDWHSAVHGHWLLVRLLRRFPDLPQARAIRGRLDAHLTADNIRVEAEYLEQANRQSFERTYGWAWLLKLAEELRDWNDPDSTRWSWNVRPLAEALSARLRRFLPLQNYPIRTGVHPNTAFALTFGLDYARAAGDRDLETTILERARAYYARDTGYPAAWEPGGEDFFSPALMEADLMRRVLGPADFAGWLKRFLPELDRSGPRALLEPAVVTDRTDPKLVHLDGLNLSRAWCMRQVAATLPAGAPARKVLTDAADAHTRAGLEHLASGDYAGEHWLASFAVYLLTTTR